MDQSQLEVIDAGGGWPHYQLLEAIVMSSDDAIIGKTLDGVITSWNPAAERMYGYAAREIVGQPISVLCPPDRVGEITTILTAIGWGERVVHFETVRRRKDGTTIPVSVTISPIHDQVGRLIGASSIARDTSAQAHAAAEIQALSAELRAGLEARVLQRTADLERANESLETFTYSVAHDLRSPLRGLNGFSEALLEEYGEALGETGRGYAGRIQAASERMGTLIDELLRLSRVSSAAMNLGPVDLSAEVAVIAAELQSAEPGRRVRLVIEDDVRVTADRTLIHTVLQNLVGNAWKFTARRDDATIEFGTTTADDAEVCYYLSDNGAGFDPAYLDKLFQPFQRLHTTSEFPGTGVGLASVRQIVQGHGGRVWADGAVGEGATFYFTLDAKEIT